VDGTISLQLTSEPYCLSAPAAHNKNVRPPLLLGDEQTRKNHSIFFCYTTFMPKMNTRNGHCLKFVYSEIKIVVGLRAVALLTTHTHTRQIHSSQSQAPIIVLLHIIQTIGFDDQRRGEHHQQANNTSTTKQSSSNPSTLFPTTKSVQICLF
jgi:hypothetical protein